MILQDNLQVYLNNDDIEFCIKDNKRKWEVKNKNPRFLHVIENKFVWNATTIDKHLSKFLLNYDKKENNINVLDIGTCDGVQAEHISKLGFNTLGTDVSQTAIDKAVKRYTSGNLDFVHDDILETKLKPNSFDIIFDRGCFHSIVSFGHSLYIRNVKKLLNENGTLLLKVMHNDQEKFMGWDRIGKDRKIVKMPYKFTKRLLTKAFGRDFSIESIEDSEFESDYGSKNNLKFKALFSVLKKL